MLRKLLTAYIINNLRILKKLNPGDNYYDEYLKHWNREGDNFYDQYHLAVEWVIEHKPKRILEIGTRTGLSIIQLLSAHPEREKIERVVLCDIWNDGYASPKIVSMYFDYMNLPLDKVQFIIGDSHTEIPKLEKEFDYILVDGSHDKKDARADLNNAIKLLAEGGVLVFDDISKYGCDLIDVFEDFVDSLPKDKYNTTFDMNGKGVGWIIKK